jgi:hypothetical protein
MDSALPPTAFIDPYGRNHDQIRGLLSRVVEVLLSNLTDAEKRPPFPEAKEFAEFPSNFRPLQELGKWSWSPVSDTRCGT